jgi:hypothetical protein
MAELTRLLWLCGAVSVVFMLVICGCTSNEQSRGSSKAPGITPSVTSPQPLNPTVSPVRGPPSVFIIAPPFDGGILAGNVTILVEVTNFTLAPLGGTNVPGTGHLVYYMDVTPVTIRDHPAFTRPGTYTSSSATMHTWQGITSGTHTFAVQLVNSDDTPLDPPMVDAIDVTAVQPEMITTP